MTGGFQDCHDPSALALDELLPPRLSALSPAALVQLRSLGLLRTCLQAALLEDAVESVQLSRDEQQQLLAVYCKQHGLGGAEALNDHLRSRGLSLPVVLEELSRPAKLKRHAQLTYGAKAEARFLERKNSLDQVVYSLLRVRDADLARELYLRLLEEESTFPELAAQYAEGPERQTHGIIGPVPLTQAHPALAERLRTHQPGTLMSPFSVQDWWLVVRLERLIPASFDAAMAQAMSQELFEASLSEDVGRALKSLLSVLDQNPPA